LKLAGSGAAGPMPLGSVAVSWTIVLFLLQDAVINGATYALIGLSLVLVFATTRVIWIPQGELVAFGALTLATLEQGHAPDLVKFVVLLSFAAAALDAYRNRESLTARYISVLALKDVIAPVVLLLIVEATAPMKLGPYFYSILSIAVVAPISPLLYRIAIQPLARASILVLMIAAIGVHLSLVGLGLLFFGPEGMRAVPLADYRVFLAGLVFNGQSVAILVVAAFTIAALWLFFMRTSLGRALRASAINRTGAQLVGISLPFTGRIAFSLAGIIGAVSGVLIAPTTTIYYDSGFMIGLKGFVAAIIGGMLSYPVTAAAAFLVAGVESFASFTLSAYKESIVFALLIPFLLWRSLQVRALEEDDEE
jgi:branched-chain amino acid transport system permease protein